MCLTVTALCSSPESSMGIDDEEREMWWFGGEIPVLHPLPACPCSQLPPAEQGSLGSVDICMESLNICLKLCAKSNSALQRLEQGGGHTQVGFGAALLQTGKSGGEKSGERREGSWGNLNSVHSVHVKCLKPVQAASSTLWPPDLVQSLLWRVLFGIVLLGSSCAECLGVLGSTQWGNVSEGGAGSAGLWLKE